MRAFIPSRLIEKKRRGEELAREELEDFLRVRKLHGGTRPGEPGSPPGEEG